MFFSAMDLYLDSNHLSCEKQTGSPCLALVGLMTGRPAEQNVARFQNLCNPLQVKLFGFLLWWYQCNVINSARSAFQSFFHKQRVF